MSYYGTTDYSYNSDFSLRVRDMKKGNLDFGWLDVNAFAADQLDDGHLGRVPTARAGGTHPLHHLGCAGTLSEAADPAGKKPPSARSSAG